MLWQRIELVILIYLSLRSTKLIFCKGCTASTTNHSGDEGGNDWLWSSFRINFQGNQPWEVQFQQGCRPPLATRNDYGKPRHEIARSIIALIDHMCQTINIALVAIGNTRQESELPSEPIDAEDALTRFWGTGTFLPRRWRISVPELQLLQNLSTIFQQA
jgi:hypothetical protein